MKFNKKLRHNEELEGRLLEISRRIEKNNVKNREISKQLEYIKNLIIQQNIRNLRENTHGKIDTSYLDVHALSYSSQHNEDGVILSIIDSIGLTGGISYELGAGDNGGCTGTLSLLRNFKSVFIEQDQKLVDILRNKFLFGDNRIVCERILPSNVNSLVSEKPDVLSCDLDSIDYWILSSLEYNPLVIIAEYNASLGSQHCVTVPLDYLNLDISPEMKIGQYYGCSLSALTKLFESRNMSLVYCDNSGTNAFFIDNNYQDSFTKLSPTQAFRTSKNSELAFSRGYTPDKIVSSFKWEKV